MKIIAIGRNYAQHAAELQNATPQKPIVFLKPDTAVLRNGEPFYYPEFSKDIHYELEIVVKISKESKHIEPKFAHKYYNDIGIGIDFTARDLQNQLKQQQLPWEIAKAFDHSALVGDFMHKTELDLSNIDFKLQINGQTRQHGNSKDMIFKIDYLIHYISQFFTLRAGDLLFTGTPAGVGAVKIGDHLEGFLNDKPMLNTKIK